MIRIQRLVPGFILVLLLSVLAFFLGQWLPVVGKPVFGMVLGMLLAHLWPKRPQSLNEGIAFSRKELLQGAIVFMGAGLSLSEVWQTGTESFTVMILTLVVALLTAYLCGRFLKIPRKLQALIGVGTAICGGSAIAAVSPIIEAEEVDIAYSISVIFLFNVLAVLIFPPLGQLFGLSETGFGLWAGTAINDTSSVVAAGYAFGERSGNYATVVKLTRTTMIIPICFFLSFYMLYKRRQLAAETAGAPVAVRKVFPMFIFYFLLACFLNTLGLMPDNVAGFCTNLGKFMIVMALTSIGLSTNFQNLVKPGLMPLLLGLLVWMMTAVSSLVIQMLTQKV